jgi:hypothetical protein
MKHPMTWTIFAIIFILIGTGLFVYSGTCVTVEKNGKKRSVVHGVYIVIGVILILASIFILILIARDLRIYAKVKPGMTLVPVPEKFGNWLSENMSSQPKFTNTIGKYIDNTYKSIKDIFPQSYKFFKTEPGSEN